MSFSEGNIIGLRAIKATVEEFGDVNKEPMTLDFAESC